MPSGPACGCIARSGQAAGVRVVVAADQRAPYCLVAPARPAGVRGGERGVPAVEVAKLRNVRHAALQFPCARGAALRQGTGLRLWALSPQWCRPVCNFPPVSNFSCSGSGFSSPCSGSTSRCPGPCGACCRASPLRLLHVVSVRLFRAIPGACGSTIRNGALPLSIFALSTRAPNLLWRSVWHEPCRPATRGC